MPKRSVRSAVVIFAPNARWPTMPSTMYGMPVEKMR
jgi:hypothetical protein